jgi:hypothetical protein
MSLTDHPLPDLGCLGSLLFNFRHLRRFAV